MPVIQVVGQLTLRQDDTKALNTHMYSIGYMHPTSSLLITVGVPSRYAADECNATSPPCRVLYMVRRITRSLRPPSHIQHLHRSHWTWRPKDPSETYLFISHSRNCDNTKPIISGVTLCWGSRSVICSSSMGIEIQATGTWLSVWRDE